MICTGGAEELRRSPRRALGESSKVLTKASALGRGWSSANRRAPSHERDPVSLEDRLPMGRDSGGVREPQYVLSAIRRVDERWRVQNDVRRNAAALRPRARHRMGLGLPRQRFGEGAKRGDLTGPNPTDRAKLGSKRHVLTDGRGVPIAVTLTAANTHDKWGLGPTLDAVPLQASRGPRRPKNLCLDKAYDWDDTEREVRRRGIRPHMCRRAVRKDAISPKLLKQREQPRGRRRGRPRRWVVERTNSWHNNFRALRVRWELRPERYLSLVHFACALIAFRASTRRNGHRF